jgi:hypothetical protein
MTRNVASVHGQTLVDRSKPRLSGRSPLEEAVCVCHALMLI